MEAADLERLNREAMEAAEIDLERQRRVENARIDAEAKYSKKSGDAVSLTLWGRTLVELAQYANVKESKKLHEDALSKFQTALTIDPTMHEAVWGLGTAHSAKAFLMRDHEEAKVSFDLAYERFEKALEMCPGHQDYLYSLKSCAKGAPEYHKALCSNVVVQSDSSYEIFVWGILAVGLFAWIAVANSNGPPPPSR